MRYVVRCTREGHAPEYWSKRGLLTTDRRDARTYSEIDLEKPGPLSELVEWLRKEDNDDGAWIVKVVRLLSREEAKTRAIATEIRRIVEEDCMDGLFTLVAKDEKGNATLKLQAIRCDFLLKRAAEMWPAPKARKR